MIQDTSLSSRILGMVIHISLAVLLFVTLYPMLHIFSVSLSSGTAVSKSQVTFFPVELEFDAYEMVFQANKVPRAFKNSIIYTSLGTIINLVMTVTMAYPLSKKRLTLRGFYTRVVA